MLFVEPRFFLFFAIVFALYWSLRRNGQRKLLLLAASYVFYGAWDARFTLLLGFSTLFDFLTGLAMAANLDVRFEEALAKNTSLPAFLVDPTRSLETSSAVQSRLASLRPPSQFALRQKEASLTPVASQAGVAVISGIPGLRLTAVML